MLAGAASDEQKHLVLRPLLGPSFVVWSPAQGRVETIPARSMSSAPALVQIKGHFIGWWWVAARARGGFCENEITPRTRKRESQTGSSVTVGPTLFHTLHQCTPQPPSPTPSTTPEPAFLQGGGPSQRPLLSPLSSLSDLLSSDHTLGSPQGKIQNKGRGKGGRDTDEGP